MNKTRHFLGLIILLLIGGLYSCLDHRLPVITPGSNQLRVKTIIQQSINQQATPGSSVSVVSAFSYDNQNRISSILAYQLPDSTAAPVEKTIYQYDTQSRLTKVKHSDVRVASRSETYTLTYEAGNLSGIRNDPSTFGISTTYDATNHPANFTKSVVPLGGLQFSDSGSFTYTGNNLTASIEKVLFIRLGEPRPLADYTVNTTYTYDDKLNPFYGAFIVPALGSYQPGLLQGGGVASTLYGGIDNRLNFSQNNVLSAVSDGGTTTTYAYTYNAANLPTTRLTTTGGGVTEIRRFEYEPY